MKLIHLLQSSFFVLIAACTASSNSLTVDNTTVNTPSVSSSEITCYKPGEGEVRLPISIDKCRSLLRMLTTLPNYRAIQEFRTGCSPRLPGAAGTPPYTWWNSSTTCGIRLESHYPFLGQKFAWVQVRALAMEILDYCEEYSVGYGGLAPIGTPECGIEGFSVRIVGASIYPPPPITRGTDDAFGSLETASAAVEETLWLDTS